MCYKFGEYIDCSRWQRFIGERPGTDTEPEVADPLASASPISLVDVPTGTEVSEDDLASGVLCLTPWCDDLLYIVLNLWNHAVATSPSLTWHSARTDRHVKLWYEETVNAGYPFLLARSSTDLLACGSFRKLWNTELSHLSVKPTCV